MCSRTWTRTRRCKMRRSSRSRVHSSGRRLVTCTRRADRTSGIACRRCRQRSKSRPCTPAAGRSRPIACKRGASSCSCRRADLYPSIDFRRRIRAEARRAKASRMRGRPSAMLPIPPARECTRGAVISRKAGWGPGEIHFMGKSDPRNHPSGEERSSPRSPTRRRS